MPVDKDDYLVFSSNDYLGLKSHPKVIEAARNSISSEVGTGASRLVTGTRQKHRDLEAKLAEYKSCESALVFSSGYAANIGVLSTFGTNKAVIISDELNHASIVDGCRLARSEVLKFKHLDYDQCENQLKIVNSEGKLGLVVTDSVFSMDGDVADIDRLSEICSKFGALLVVDDAHNVFNAHFNVDPDLTLIVGTLSKTFGSLGGFVGGRRGFIDLLINQARSFIFTTGLSLPDTAAGLAAVEIVNSDEGTELLNKLRDNITYFKTMVQADLDTMTPIVPIVIGREDKAVEISNKLREDKILIPAIRPPTVPVGTSRLRVTLSAEHSYDQIEYLGLKLREAMKAI